MVRQNDERKRLKNFTHTRQALPNLFVRRSVGIRSGKSSRLLCRKNQILFRAVNTRVD